MNNLGVHDVKSKQFLLITKAGLAVSQSKEKGMVNIEQQVMTEDTEAVKAIFLPPAFLGYDRNGFMRTKNYFVDVAKLDPNDLHTGATLWRKYKEIRLILMNDFAPLLTKRLPGGLPPSGKSFAEILTAVRNQYSLCILVSPTSHIFPGNSQFLQELKGDCNILQSSLSQSTHRTS